MSIGRSFGESLQKGLCSMEKGLTGLNTPFIEELEGATGVEEKRQVLCETLKYSTPDRLLVIAEAMRWGVSLTKIYEIYPNGSLVSPRDSKNCGCRK